MVAISRNFKTAILQKMQIEKSTLTGAEVENWIDVLSFQISITEIKNTLLVDKTRKQIKTYKGLTKCSLLEANTTRIYIPGTKEYFNVNDVTSSLWNNIELSKVEVF